MPTLPEPTWGPIDEAQLAGGADPTAFCGGRNKPSWITGYLQALLQEHFSLPTNIANEQLRRLIWQENSDDESAQTKIHIEPSYSYDITHLQQRPALHISRGPIQSARMAISDKVLTHLTRRGDYEGEDYLRMLQGQHQVIVCGNKSEMAVEKLAEEVFYFLLEYHPAIRKDMQLSNFIVTGMTEIEKIDEDHENFMVGVQCAWMTAHCWTLKPLAPILKSIGFISE